MKDVWGHSGSMDQSLSELEIRHRTLAREAAVEGIVLLKNEGVLPLSTASAIALLGSGAEKTIKGGIGSGDVNNRENISIYQGMKEAGVTITSEDWLEDYEYCQLGLPQPNLVLFLSLPLELSQKLLAKRYDGDASKKDIHEADLAYLEQCDRAARYAGEKLGWQFVEVSDGRQLYPVEQIRDELYRRIQEAFAC